MYQASIIESCLAGLVGMFQPNDPAFPLIENDLARSTSGLFVEGAHPLVSMENVFCISPEFAAYNYPAHVANRTYPTGARVKIGSVIYQALTLTTTTPPSTENWKVVDPFSEWLRRIYKAACGNLAGEISKLKTLDNAGKSLLDTQALYSGYGMLTDKIIKRGRFVAFEITPQVVQGLALEVVQFAIQVDTPGTFNLYLYNSSQADPVKTFPIDIAKANTFQWNDITDSVIGYMKGGADVGSSWYLGYYEDDLTGQAISRPNNIADAPCSTCNSFDIAAYSKWSKYARIVPFYVAEDYLTEGRTLFDVAGIRYDKATNWGMNISLSATCDISDVICRNKRLLAQALRMQIALDLLHCIGFTTRINTVSEKTSAYARADLSTKPGSGSFMLQYLDEIKAANLDLSGLNSICLPCSTKGRISYGSL